LITVWVCDKEKRFLKGECRKQFQAAAHNEYVSAVLFGWHVDRQAGRAAVDETDMRWFISSTAIRFYQTACSLSLTACEWRRTDQRQSDIIEQVPAAGKLCY
jgi:hypothetical protein